jgi:ferredoxin-NADP reductase
MTASPDNPEVKVPKPAYFYLCGWKDMIEEAKQRIQAMGYDRKSIHQELYG